MRILKALSVCLLAVSLLPGAEKASRLYKEGRQAEQDGQISKAYLLYSQAAALDPNHPFYWARSQALRRRAILESKVTPEDAASPAAPDQSLPPITGTLTEKDLVEARRPQPPRELKALPGQKDFDLRGDAKFLFESVARAFGLQTVFDSEYPAGRPFHFRIDKAGYREALRTLEALTGSFVAPLGERLVIVAKDNPQKRLQVEPTAAVLIPIPEPVSLQEAQELARTVQQAFDIRRLFVDTRQRAVFLRDGISKIQPARQIFAQLLHLRAQVIIEVEFLEVSKTSSLNLGISLPTEFPLLNFGKIWNSITASPSGIAQFAMFGGGKTLLGIGIGSAEAVANLSKSEAQSLLSAQLRSLDGQAVSFHVGDKFPVRTGYFMGGGTAGQSYNSVPNFNFEDLGFVMKLTPHVHGQEGMTLDVEAEFKILSGQSLNDLPIIANRKFQCQVRMGMGEWAIIAGMMTSTEARTISGLAGLSNLPVLGPLLRRHSKTREDREALLILKPRLLSLPASEEPSPAVWVGAETRFLIPL